MSQSGSTSWSIWYQTTDTLPGLPATLGRPERREDAGVAHHLFRDERPGAGVELARRVGEAADPDAEAAARIVELGGLDDAAVDRVVDQLAEAGVVARSQPGPVVDDPG